MPVFHTKRRTKLLGVGIAVSLPLIYLAYLAFLYHAQLAMFYPGRHYPLPANHDQLPTKAERWWLPVHGGNVKAWYLQPEAGNLHTAAPVIVFAHGNGERIDDWPTLLAPWRQRGFGLLMVEYPGYGASTGEPREDSIRSAFVAAYDRLVQRPDVDRERIVGYGQSLGGGVIAQLAANRPLRALILQSTFSSPSSLAKRFLAPGFLLKDKYDTLGVVSEFNGPVLVIHGKHDEVIPVTEGQQLANAAKNGELIEYDYGHTCWDFEKTGYWCDVPAFLFAAGVIRAN